MPKYCLRLVCVLAFAILVLSAMLRIRDIRFSFVFAEACLSEHVRARAIMVAIGFASGA